MILEHWETRAHSLIAELARVSYLEANTDRRGNRYRRHRPYSLPTIARDLVECLGTRNEERAKAIFFLVSDVPEVVRDR